MKFFQEEYASGFPFFSFCLLYSDWKPISSTEERSFVVGAEFFACGAGYAEVGSRVFGSTANPSSRSCKWVASKDSSLLIVKDVCTFPVQTVSSIIGVVSGHWATSTIPGKRNCQIRHWYCRQSFPYLTEPPVSILIICRTQTWVLKAWQGIQPYGFGSLLLYSFRSTNGSLLFACFIHV